MQVEREELTNILDIEVTDSDPAFAQKLAATIARTYQELHAEKQMKRTTEAIKYIADQLAEIQDSSKQEMISTGSRSQWSSSVVTIVAFIMAAVLSFFLIRSIIKPIKRAIESLTEGADQVASASSQVSSASQSLAEGSAESPSLPRVFYWP